MMVGRTFPLLVFLSVGCASSEYGFVQGGYVDEEGWPTRNIPGQTVTEKRLRCPENSTLVDERLSLGGRRVRCAFGDNPIPRGFEIEWYKNGQLALLFTTSSSGEPLRRSRFFRDGAKQSEETFKDGRVDFRETFWENGVKESERIYDPEGFVVVSKWRSDGSVRSHGKMKSGRKTGRWIEEGDGGAAEIRQYVNGQLEGKVERKFVDGSTEIGQYRAGKREGVWSKTDYKGRAESEVRYENGLLEGPAKYWHPNRQIREEGAFVLGKRDGVWIRNYVTGLIAKRAFWVCGLKHGPWAEFHPNGEKKYVGVHVRDVQVGEWKRYQAGGQLQSVDTFDAPEDRSPPVCKSEPTSQPVESDR